MWWNMHGRWHNLGSKTGLWVGEASDATAVYKFLWNWSEEMANCKVEID